MDATSSRRVEIEGVPPCKNPRHMSLPSFFQPRETIVNPPDLCPNPPTIRCLSALSLSLSLRQLSLRGRIHAHYAVTRVHIRGDILPITERGVGRQLGNQSEEFLFSSSGGD